MEDKVWLSHEKNYFLLTFDHLHETQLGILKLQKMCCTSDFAISPPSQSYKFESGRGLKTFVIFNVIMIQVCNMLLAQIEK